MQLMLFVMYASAGLTTVRRFVRNHRVHHKCSDSDGDPHDARRGLFFSHMGWLMVKKNEETLRQGKTIDMKDLDNDPLIMFHERHMLLVNGTLCFVLPTLANIWFFGESWRCAVAWQCFIRYLTTMHAAFSVNSLAHKYGHKPYNRNIRPVENLFVVFATLGEGFHNYHHAFPFDFKGTDRLLTFNIATLTIKLCEKIGWAYDLKEASPEMVASMSQRMGDRFQLKEGLSDYSY
ncbi:hypothetical protein O3G_MSEX002157 [Manduca sexta]|uniref:Fatty acid desaturase domain-containing protein n=2 Tax=Manduca sexta TaxID=7130 RepID=A0A921YMW7_MANSE|nr:hypothetical protein O3G_MSEX002157 [Manduca sexta]